MNKFNYKPNPILDQVKRRISEKDLDWICVIVGDRGVGKSTSGLTICSYLDPNFNVDRVVFSAKEFLDLLTKEQLPPGSAIMLDEAGTFIYRREALSKDVRAMNKVFQICRGLKYVLVLTLPAWAMLDAHCQSMANCQLEGVRRYTDQGYVKFKIKNIKVNATKEKLKIYYKYPKLYSKEKHKFITTIHLVICRPHNDIYSAYSKKKNIRIHDLIGSLDDDMIAETIRKERAMQPSKKELIIKELEKGVKTPAEIAKDVGCTARHIQQIRTELPETKKNKKGDHI